MAACFVTGTDTGVGKTTVSCALLAAGAKRGLRTIGMKPAESGCTRTESGQLRPHDAQALLDASSLPLTLDDICQYRFHDAVAPGVAATNAGRHIDFAHIADAVAHIHRRAPDLLLVEGAGGLLVPFSDDLVAADLAAALGLPLLVVARPDLGTINHTRLTLEAAEQRHLPIAGFVFSDTRGDLDPSFVARNAREITRAHRAPYLGCLPRVSDTSTLADSGILDRLLEAVHTLD